MSPIVIPPAVTADWEGWSLDGLDLNGDGTYMIESISAPPPPKRPEWISGSDSDGAILGRDPLHDNRVIEMHLRVEQQATMDAALAHVAEIIDKLEECERLAEGLNLVWDPAGSTLDPITFHCLSGEITELPMDVQSGWFVRSPVLTLRLTCLPFAEGAEVLLGTVTSTDPIVSLELTGVAGDVDARARVVVTDNASQSRRYASVGLESRWYPLTSPPSLIVDSASMVTAGYAGVTGTRSGAYSGGSNNVITATLRTQVQAVCGLPNLLHVGTFRPQLRFYASATTIALRLTWQALDGPMRSLSYKIPVTVGWNHVDLGCVTIGEAMLGGQRWTGRLEAYSTSTGGEVLDVDVLMMMPAERFGRARASYTYTPGVLTAYDDFTGTASGVALNGRVAPSGPTWATSGAATDFVAADAPLATDETMTRSTTADASPRYAILGTTNYTAVEASVPVSFAAIGDYSQMLVVRWTDASNHLRITFQSGSSLVVTKVVAGVSTNIAVSASYGASRENTWYQLRGVLFASGQGVASLLDGAGAVLLTVSFVDTVLATAGTLATGKPGLADYGQTGAQERWYDSIYVSTLAAEPIVCYSGQSIEFRHDSTLRKDAAGTYAGPPPEYVGSRFHVPCAGDVGRKTRVAAIARRNDVETTADDSIADSTTLAVYATPRYLAIPR